MRNHKLRLFCAASVAAIATAGPAGAQSTISRDKVEALEAQINALQQELRDLKGKVSKAEQTAQKAYAANAPSSKAAPPTPPTPAAPIAVAKMTPSYRPSICAIEGIPGIWTKTGVPVIDNANCIAFTSRLHFDAGGYDYRPNTRPDLVHTTLPFTVPQNLDSGVNARRARLGVIGTFQTDWVYSLIYDFGGSSDGFTSSTIGCAGASGCRIGLLPGGITSGIQTAYLSYQGLKGKGEHGPWNVAIEGGYSDTLYSLDEATSSNDIMFMERASAQVIANNIAAGDFRSNVGGRAYGDWFWAGVYATGPTSGAMHSATGAVRAGTFGSVGQPLSNLAPPDGTSEQFGGFARAVVHYGDPKQASIHIGGDVEELFKPAFDWVTGAQSLSLADRPELRIDPTTIVGTNIQGGPGYTGALSGVGATNAIQNVSRAIVYSIEAAGNLGPVFVQGEYFWFDVDRRLFPVQPASSSAGVASVTGPNLHFNGGYVEASWTMTGETRTYNNAAAAYNGVVPANPFSWSKGGWGAWEIAGRYSVIDLNDQLGFAGGASGGKQTIWAAGLNWYVNRNIRFMLDYLHGTIEKQASPLDVHDTGARFDAVAARTQIAF
jgi:phosphate-selective porin OprO and OprP